MNTMDFSKRGKTALIIILCLGMAFIIGRNLASSFPFGFPKHVPKSERPEIDQVDFSNKSMISDSK